MTPTFSMVLLILAAVFGLLGLLDVPRSTKWAAAGVLCLALDLLLGAGLLT